MDPWDSKIKLISVHYTVNSNFEFFWGGGGGVVLTCLTNFGDHTPLAGKGCGGCPTGQRLAFLRNIGGYFNSPTAEQSFEIFWTFPALQVCAAVFLY